jgi:hypothetical protein
MRRGLSKGFARILTEKAGDFVTQTRYRNYISLSAMASLLSEPVICSGATFSAAGKARQLKCNLPQKNGISDEQQLTVRK